MNEPDPFVIRTVPPLAPAPAAAVAGLSYLLPLLLSIGATPSPANPDTLAWYTALRKPRWAPPDAAVPLVWAALETGLAAGAYRLLRRRPGAPRTRALAAWAVNVAMIGGWSRMFFRGRDLDASTAGAAAMVAAGAAYVATARAVDPPAAKAALPTWVGWCSPRCSRPRCARSTGVDRAGGARPDGQRRAVRRQCAPWQAPPDP